MAFNKILQIIKKNIRILVKSKGSAMIVIIGPLLLIFLAGLAFDNSNAYKINVGIYSPSYTPVINSFLDKLNTVQFTVVKFDSEQNCVDSIKQGVSHTCVVFPPGFNIEGDTTNKVTFYVDYSKVNLVWMVRDTLFSKISEQATEITTSLTETLIKKIDDTLKEIKAKNAVLSEFSTSNAKNSQMVSSAKAELIALDLSLDRNSLNLSEIQSKMAELNSIAVQSINESRAALNHIEDEASSSNLSISDILEKARKDLDNLEGRINSTAGQNSSSITALIASFNTKIDAAKTKFDKASSTRSNVSKELDAVKLGLDSDITKIALLKSSFNSIVSNLENASLQKAEAIAMPITTVVKPVSAKSYLGYMFPILVAMLTMFVSVVFSTTIIITEKRSSAHFRNLITPTKETLFLIGAYLTNMILSAIQIIVLLVISIIFFKTQILGILPSVFVLLFVVATFFTLVGILIGQLFHSEETATLAAISVCSILLLLSSVVLPLESMPQYLINIAKFNPFVISELLLRREIIFETPLFNLGREMLWLLGYILLAAVAVFMVQRISPKIAKPKQPKHIIKIMPVTPAPVSEPKKEEKNARKVIPAIRQAPVQQPINRTAAESKHEKQQKNISKAATLSDLIELLAQMESEEFSRHPKQEFYDWVMTNIKDSALAERILKTETKKELEQEFQIEYERHLRRIEELKRKIAEKKKA